MGGRRRVVRTKGFIRRAQDLYPSGSPEGRPSFQAFEAGPLAAAEEAFARSFDTLLPEAAEGTGIHIASTKWTPFFPPMNFYARLTGDGDVELLDVEPDEEYWDLVGDDPDD